MCESCGKETGDAMSRRAFMLLSAGAIGAGIVATAGSEPTKSEKVVAKTMRPVPQPVAVASLQPPKNTPAVVREGRSVMPHQRAERQAAAAVHPAKDMGQVLFPNAANEPLAVAADAPVTVIPRRRWTGAPPNLRQIVLMNGVQRITIHHTASEYESDAWHGTAAEIENIRTFHSGAKVTDRHWADIAYHFLVDRAGRVWQGRPLIYQGAHVKGHNEHNLGIVLLGNFELQRGTAAQLTSLREFVGFVRGLYHVPLSEVHTHRELADNGTDCPGKSLQEYLDRVRPTWG